MDGLSYEMETEMETELVRIGLSCVYEWIVQDTDTYVAENQEVFSIPFPHNPATLTKERDRWQNIQDYSTYCHCYF